MKNLTLTQGHYLAPEYTTREFNHLLVAITEYQVPSITGQWHAHENPLISFVLYGKNLEYRKNQQLERTTGCINFYHAYEPHQNIYKQFPSKHISLEMDHLFLKRHELSENDVALALRKNLWASFALLQIFNEALIQDIHSASSIELLLLDLVHRSHQIKEVHTHPQWLQTIRELLHDQWQHTMSLQQLANVTGIYPSSISKHFSRYFGCTLGDYCRKIKVSKAIERMKSSAASLTEIAYYCGFADQSHFIKVFKRITGFSPKAYRKL